MFRSPARFLSRLRARLALGPASRAGLDDLLPRDDPRKPVWPPIELVRRLERLAPVTAPAARAVGAADAGDPEALGATAPCADVADLRHRLSRTIGSIGTSDPAARQAARATRDALDRGVGRRLRALFPALLDHLEPRLAAAPRTATEWGARLDAALSGLPDAEAAALRAAVAARGDAPGAAPAWRGMRLAMVDHRIHGLRADDRPVIRAALADADPALVEAGAAALLAMYHTEFERHSPGPETFGHDRALLAQAAGRIRPVPPSVAALLAWIAENDRRHARTPPSIP